MNKRMQKIRKDLRMSQEAFGERIGVTKSSISMLESGKNNPSEQTIKLICKEFGIDYLWLKTGEGDMKEPITIEDDMALVRKVMAGENELARNLFLALAKMPTEDWRKVEEILDTLDGLMEKTKK